MPKIKTVKEMKNVSNGIISRQETAEERISKLENILIKFLETEKQRAKSRVKQNRISEGCGKTTRGVTYTQWKLLLLFSWCAVLRLVTQSCLTLCHSMVCSPPGSSVRGNSPGKNTGMSCHALLQGNFPIPGSNPGLPHCRQILYQLRHQESPVWCQVMSNYFVNLMDCSPSRCSVHGISQARILDCVANSFSRGSSQLRD